MHKAHYSKAELFIRSLTYIAISSTTIALYSFVVIGLFFLPLRARHAVIRAYLGWNLRMLKWICHIDYVVEGLENIPRDKVGVLMIKHQSTWETFFLSTVFHAPAVIIKRELLWVPFFGWGLALSQPISINRQDKSSAMQQIITKGKQCLAEKRWLGVFPEGTRVPYGTVGKYRMGGARLAIAADTFILPIAHNAGRFWPRRGFIKYPGTVRVVIGPPIESKGRTPEELLAITKDWIESTVDRIG